MPIFTLHEKAELGLLKYENLTEEELNSRDKHGKTVWHYAVSRDYIFKNIPKHLFPAKVLNQIDEHGQKMWHIAAECNTLELIPEHLFTSEALAQRNKDGEAVWHIAAKFKTLKDINQDCFSHEALELKDEKGGSVWSKIAFHREIEEIPLHLINTSVFFIKTVWRLKIRLLTR